jgi:hypothetical protein
MHAFPIFDGAVPTGTWTPGLPGGAGGDAARTSRSGAVVALAAAGMVSGEIPVPPGSGAHETPAAASLSGGERKAGGDFPEVPAPRGPDAATAPGLCADGAAGFAPSASAPSPRALLERNRRAQLVRTFYELRAAGQGFEAAARRMGVAVATLHGYVKAFEAGGEAALTPGTHRCGRRSHLAAFGLTAEFTAKIRELALRVESAELAWRLAAEEAECPAALRAYLAGARRIPRSLLKLARVNPQVRELGRGARAYQLNSYESFRDMTEVLPTGERVQIQPGDWWELDDMSVNQPFWYELPEGVEARPDRLAERHGAGLGRQGLYALDVASGKWLGHLLIGRPRDAYRAEDILRFLRGLMTAWGKPRRGVRIERGTWRSKRIKGLTLEADDTWAEEEVERAGLAEGEQRILVAGLHQLGIEVVFAYSPHQKGFIEGGFRQLQKVMAARPHANVGRYRGEFEAAARAWTAVKAGVAHPSRRGFGHITEVSESLAWAMTWLNGREKQGALQRGIPDERWVAAEARFGRRELTRDDLAVFLPERSELRVDGGHVAPVRGGQVYPFTAPELFAAMGNGFRVAVAFDPAEPELGCAIWNAETSSANRAGWAAGQFLGWAAYEAPGPQFGRAADGSAAAENRRRYRNWHRTELRIITSFGRGVAREGAARDGRGTVGKVQGPGAEVQGPGAEVQGPRSEVTPLTSPLLPPPSPLVPSPSRRLFDRPEAGTLQRQRSTIALLAQRARELSDPTTPTPRIDQEEPHAEPDPIPAT